MSGGKGGSTASSVTIPEYIEAAAQRNLNKAERISQIGYTPYYGPDVAAFTPMQQAAFQGTAQTAGAFGLPGGGMSQQDIMGGMPAPTTYAGGVQGYSAAPIYEQSLQTLGERRPGQKAYIDSFFIDPYAGGAAAGNFAPIDYTDYQTGAQMASGGDDGSGAGMPAGDGSSGGQGVYAVPGYTTYGGHQDIAHEMIDNSFINYGQSIAAGTARPEDNPAYNAGVAAANQNTPVTFTNQDTGQTITKPASQLTSSDFDGVDQQTASQMAAASMLSAGISNVGGGFNQNDPTTGFLGGVTDVFGNLVENLAGSPFPTPASLIAGAIDAPDSTYNPVAASNNTAHMDMMNNNPAFAAPSFAIGGNLSNETSLIANPNLSDDDFWDMAESDPTVGSDNDSSSGSSGGGCVVATHAVNSGAFSPTTKREAVVWCMNVLHGKWWGEAIRRGYRYLGRKKIEQGKAAEHYQEFRNYIAFATGKKRTVKGALHFAARTVQFLVVGLVKKDA